MDGDSTPLTTRTFSDGEVVVERFHIVRLLGAGGMGEVYEAEDRELRHERIALKTLPATLAASDAAIERLRDELLLARRVTHANVCRVHDVYQVRRPSGALLLILTMELLEGATLADRLVRGPLTAAVALPI